MTVFVDQMMTTVPDKNWPYNNSCHLYADDVEELHRFALSIGLRRDWFQDHNSLPHYDLTSGRRVWAVRKGAVSQTWHQLVEHMDKLREQQGLDKFVKSD